MTAAGDSGPPTLSGAPAGSISGGRYRLEGLLGRGGVGSVYRAYDCERRAAVALKRLEFSGSGSHGSMRPGGTNPPSRNQARRRAQLTALFQREYHTLTQLSHPRIVEVYDYGIDGAPYYT